MSDTLNLEQAAEYLKIGRASLLDHLSKGEIPSAKIGKSWVFHKEMLSEWLRTETIKQTEQRKHAHTTSAPPTTASKKPVRKGRPRNPIPNLDHAHLP
ncbi:MAG: helix-turn-helix domain-containing protein [Gammaproteobacteria bacterium]